MPIQSENARGALYMTTAMAGFGLNDGLMKLAFGSLPVAQSIALRGVVASLILLLVAWRSGALRYRPTGREASVIVLRTIGEVGATASFLVALAHMPIAEATAVLQAAPLAVTMAAALFLGEKVGVRRWSAIVVGFAGVLIMVRPGSEAFSPWALLPLVTILFVTLRDIVTRRMSAATPTVFASTITAVTITTLALVAMPFEGVAPATPLTLAALAGAAGFIVFGYFFSISAMRVGDVSFVSPFRYTVLIWAIVIGLILFHEVPDAPTIVGAIIVVGAGLYTLWREQVVGRGRPAARSPAHTMDAPRLADPRRTTQPASHEP